MARYIASISLAFAIVIGGIWLMSRSLTPMATSKGNVSATANLHRPIPQPSAEQAEKGRQNTSKSHGITKCIKNGKTIYSDSECIGVDNASSVRQYDTAGIAGLTREQIDAERRKFYAERQAEYAGKQQVTTLNANTVNASTTGELSCDYVRTRIDWLDALARQPQSAQTQDWITQEKARLRSLPC